MTMRMTTDTSASRAGAALVVALALFYEAGKDYKYYVNEAGGFGHRAKKSKTFIVYQNGKASLCKKGAKPEPGCEIVVVSKKKKKGWTIQESVAALSGLTSLAAMVTAIAYMMK